MLYRPDAFEPLTDTAWDENRLRERVCEVVADADAAYGGPDSLWPAYDWDGWGSALPLKNLYVGAAGVVWALDELRARGHADTTLDLGAIAAQTLELFRAAPDYVEGFALPSRPEAGLMTGEVGILLALLRVAPTAEAAEALYRHVRANVASETEELFFGSPGTLVAARRMLEWTGEERWREAGEESAAALLARRDADGLWRQRLYGNEFRGLTPAHGLVGNVAALRPLLDDARRATLERETNEVLRRTAFVEDGLVTWASRERPTLESPDGEIRLQWCSGAPGMVIAACDYMDEDLLLAGAELTWQAGPHGSDKGPGICHGTAGNGYAFLGAFARTGNEQWLDRARMFAVHALEQVERLKLERGRGRYGLWTGDLGAALFAADCVDARNAYPVLG